MRVQKGKKGIAVAGLLAATCGAGTAHGIVITTQTDATALANAVTAGGTGLTVTGATLSGQSSVTGAVSSGTYTNATGTYGIGSGIVISSGDVRNYGDGPNTASGNTTIFGTPATMAQEALLDPITGGSLNHNDVTQLDLAFTTSTGEVFFLVVFGSDEFAEFKGSPFIDAFGLYLDGVNIAQFNGSPINIDHPQMAFRGGTELDGVLPGSGGPMLFSASGLSTTDIHSLTFIIADSGDAQLDSTAYIASLGGVAPPPPGGTVPEPGSLALLGIGLAGLGAQRWSRARKAGAS